MIGEMIQKWMKIKEIADVCRYIPTRVEKYFYYSEFVPFGVNKKVSTN